MAIGLGDVRYGSMTSATTVATNDVVTMAVGQLLVVGVKWEDGARDVVISDPNGNIYTPLTQANNGGGPYGQLFYSVITNATDPTVVVTATFNVAGTPTTTGYARIKTAIVTGCASVPFDRENTANGSSADPAGASVTTRVANEILFCLGAEYGAGTWADAAGGVAWQIIDQDGGTMWAYAIVSSTGTYAAGFTHASMQWTLNLATFADTEVGGGSSSTQEATEGASADYSRTVRAFRALSVAAAASSATNPHSLLAQRLASATGATTAVVARLARYLRPVSATASTTAGRSRIARLAKSITTAIEAASAALDPYVGRTAWLAATTIATVTLSRSVWVARTQATVESAWAFATKGRTELLAATAASVVALSRYAKHFGTLTATSASTVGTLTIQWGMSLAAWADTVATTSWSYVNTRIQSLSATESGSATIVRRVWARKTEAATSGTTGANALRRRGVRLQQTVEAAFVAVSHRVWAARALARSYGVTAAVSRTWTKLNTLDATVVAVVDTVRLAFAQRVLDATEAASGLVSGIFGTFLILDATQATTAAIERLVLIWRTQDATHEATGALGRMVLAFRTIADALGALASLSASAPRSIVITAQAVMAVATERLVTAWRTLADASLLIVADLTAPTSGFTMQTVAGEAVMAASMQPRTRIFRSLDSTETAATRLVTRWGVLAFHRPTTAHRLKKRRTAEEA